MLYEVAKGKSFNSPRGILVHEDDLFDWVMEHGDDSIGMSTFQYKDEDKSVMEAEAPSAWFNQAYCDWVPIDVDKGDNSDVAVLHTTRSLLFQLQDIGLQASNLKVYFSGTGYHLMIHSGCFDFPKDHKDLPYVVKSTMENVARKIGFWEHIDDKVYMRTSIIRCPFSKNPKSGLYKTPLSINEVMSLVPEEIHALASSKRLDFQWEDEYHGDGELASYVNLKVPPIPVYSRVVEPVNNYSCIYKILDAGPIEGSRNNTVLVLASHFMRMGVPSYLAKQALLAWNNSSLDDKIINEKVEQVYEKKYKYSCRSRIMKAACSTRCIHYNKQTTSPGTSLSFEDIIENAKKRDFLKELAEGIKIGDILGFQQPGQFVVTRGEIVTLLGPTKSGKSTLMKNLVLGIDIANPGRLLHESTLRKTVYYTAEQASEHFLVTCCQILEGCSKDMAFANKDALLDKWKQRLSHIMPIDLMPDDATLRDHIQMYNPEVVVIDTLEHAVGSDNNNEHLGIKNFMLGLQRVCSEYGTIFYIVSQVNRYDAKDNKIALFSGKGSGAIENQSRKVFGISTTGDSKIKKIDLFADTYGEIPDENVTVYLQRSLRFKKIVV